MGFERHREDIAQLPIEIHQGTLRMNTPTVISGKRDKRWAKRRKVTLLRRDRQITKPPSRISACSMRQQKF
jgi:hypothetical protein